MNTTPDMRDAIIISGWTWEAFNIPERLALSMALLGSRVLYCANPVSRLKEKESGLTEVEPGIFGFTPRIWGHRLNLWRVTANLQSRNIADQIVRRAEQLKLRDPIVLYPWMARILPVCAELRQRGFYMVYVVVDHPQTNLQAHVALADQTLVVQRTSFHPLRAQLGEKIQFLPELAPSLKFQAELSAQTREHPLFAGIPRPRLVYVGVPQGRLHMGLLRNILKARPDWHYVHCGPPDLPDYPNAHALPWIPKDALGQILAGTDIGFMPYDCCNERDFNCAPLKLFDYFAAGLPVVSTPIIYLGEMPDLVYTGDTSAELICAVESALLEPHDSPKHARRKEIAREHSIENIALLLGRVLPLSG
jgi:hypothetical protein